MPLICNICKKTVSINKHVSCSTCHTAFDVVCVKKYKPDMKMPVNIPQIETEIWNCTTCERNQVISIDEENSVISIESDRIPNNDEQASAANREDTPQEQNENNVVCLEDEDSSDSSSSSEIRMPILGHYCDMIIQLQKINRTCEILKEENVKLKRKHRALKNSYNDLVEKCATVEQDALLNEIEILGMPESPNENLIQTLTHITNKLGVYVTALDVDYIKRIRLSMSKAATNFDPKITMHNPIVVRFVRRLMKDKILNALETMGPITTQYIVNHKPNEIGIYERLIFQKQELFRELYYRTTLYNYDKCWVKDGNIYVREEKGKEPHIINSFQFMDVFIGRATPPFEN